MPGGIVGASFIAFVIPSLLDFYVNKEGILDAVVGAGIPDSARRLLAACCVL
jgi:hypothetical protein